MTRRKLAIIAALPREIKGLVGQSKPDPKLRAAAIYLYRLESAVVVAAGMGPARVSLAFEAALADGDVSEVLSVGLAGACTPAVQPGDVGEATTVVDARTGERYRTALESGDGVILVTTATIASVRDKARLAASYRAAMVDMEAASVARLALAHSLSFRALKGISDAYDFELESLAKFADERGQFRTAAFALHTALRPAAWGPAAALGRNSTRALAALGDRLRTLMLPMEG